MMDTGTAIFWIFQFVRGLMLFILFLVVLSIFSVFWKWLWGGHDE